MSKSGLADSPFFMAPQKPIEVATPPPSKPPVQKVKEETIKEPKVKTLEKTSNRDTTTPRYHDTTIPSNHASMQPSMQASIHGVSIDIVRKAVKEFGKEAATHRFTEAEKKEIADLIYTYKNQGILTSENQITRIAVNFIIGDYKENGQNSVLHKILEALNE
jgi:hypothetical protein